ncbi:tRNA (adenosine(37)-N6)-threonylcarbamoyltransferase complex ATPase subunit type 1 TsaE [Candidatus Daviesbacteria bacterium RIFCSPHIGHO2_12_FULL_43_11]|nr:MAG: tRNA (adenosine(37)-N6)-threonylcarbamoyltransferase complex ATPase subunit type 1 TsaE [Candidatus Daviesbacteria bacterium RIFCSPHIGHO2_12_FULL_43_11]
MIYQTNSPGETQKIAKELAQKYKDGGIFALSGPLGAGKTTFIQGFAQGLGITERLLSPTFVIMRQHEIPKNPEGKLYHIDLYRLDKITEIDSLGLSEIFSNPKNIIFIEWSEKMETLLPKQTIKIHLEITSEETRQILIED